MENENDTPVNDAPQEVSSSEARMWLSTIATLVGDDPDAIVEQYLGANGDTPNIGGILQYAEAHQAVLARRLSPEHLRELNPSQRAALERFLEYLEYIEDLDAEGVDRDEQLRLALSQYSDDHDGNPVGHFIQEFILTIARFFGLEDEARQWLGIEVEAPVTAPAGPAPSFSAAPILGEQSTIPEGGANGRYRLMTVARNSGSGVLGAEMVLVAPDGTVAARYDMASGGAGRGSLPGLDDTDASRPDDPITATYRINWNDVRTGRRERAMRYGDGEAGYSFTIENPANLAAIGGAGRNYFRIHPQGNSRGTAGCLEFTDDAAARDFYRRMMSLPESERPLGLEVLNPNNLQRATGRMAFAQVDGIEEVASPDVSLLTLAASSLAATLRPVMSV